MPEHPLLEVDDLTAGYAGVAALRDLSMTVAPGEVIALLGPNGAGKSTALLSFVGLIKPMAGAVRILGNRVSTSRPYLAARSGALLVPDDRGLFYGLTVRDHFRLVRSRAGSMDEKMVLDHFPALEPLMVRRVGLLSGGEQQMLTLAKSLLGGPRLLMIDELSLGLAPKVVAQILPLISDIAKDRGIGVVLVEQHVDLALDVADRAIILSHGRAVLQGTAAELRSDRATVEAAYFGADQYGDVEGEVLPTEESPGALDLLQAQPTQKSATRHFTRSKGLDECS